jgi:polyhydroxyalkanoate synthesis regulator phasin
MQKNGISVGEMDAKLLQKIEELMLHTINQQTLIESQMKRIEILEKQINN